ELSLSLVSCFLRSALEHSLGCLFDECLSLAEAQAGELAHSLDDLDLLVANGVEDDIELGLLFSLFSSATGSRCSSNGDGSSSRNLEGLLECLNELRELDEGQAL